MPFRSSYEFNDFEIWPQNASETDEFINFRSRLCSEFFNIYVLVNVWAARRYRIYIYTPRELTTPDEGRARVRVGTPDVN